MSRVLAYIIHKSLLIFSQDPWFYYSRVLANIIPPPLVFADIIPANQPENWRGVSVWCGGSIGSSRKASVNYWPLAWWSTWRCWTEGEVSREWIRQVTQASPGVESGSAADCRGWESRRTRRQQPDCWEGCLDPSLAERSGGGVSITPQSGRVPTMGSAPLPMCCMGQTTPCVVLTLHGVLWRVGVGMGVELAWDRRSICHFRWPWRPHASNQSERLWQVVSGGPPCFQHFLLTLGSLYSSKPCHPTALQTISTSFYSHNSLRGSDS